MVEGSRVPKREPLCQIDYRFWRVTSRLPSPAYLTAVPRASPNQAQPLPIKDGGVLRAVEDVRVQMMAVPKHCEPSAQSQHCGPHCETASAHASSPIYTRFVDSSRASVIVVPHLARSILISRAQYNWDEQLG